ncbi:hypothetical protein FRC14_006886 [Serendipita sp. 396]|nr:hypothetical protein FRC14_006886 [Serendipita sp. 396]KAG8861016.1 hypothetical protein FRC20_011543 [Serendipita sp. 405]
MQPSFDLLFDPSEDAAIHWAARTGLEHALDLRTVEQLYARALPYIKNWAWALTAKHGWAEEAIDTVGDMPLAVWYVTTCPVSRVGPPSLSLTPAPRLAIVSAVTSSRA